MQHQTLVYEKFTILEHNAIDIIKSLKEYLNSRRKELPRCYFLSDEDLLNLILYKNNFKVTHITI